MSHDTSRHTIRATVECSSCGRHLRAALNSRGRWVVGRHKKPDGSRCFGTLATDHREVRT